MKDVWRHDDKNGDGIPDDERQNKAISKRKSGFFGGGSAIGPFKAFSFDDETKKLSANWLKAKKSRLLALAMKKRKYGSTFSSVPKSCDFMTNQPAQSKSSFFSNTNSSWPRTIVWGGRDKTCNVWRLVNPKGSECHVLHTIKTTDRIGACAFSPDSSLMCLGTHGGILQIYETESGVLVQSFKDKIERSDHGVGSSSSNSSSSSNKSNIKTNNNSTGAGVKTNGRVSEASKIIKIKIVKDESNGENDDIDLNDSGKLFGLLGSSGSGTNLKNSASCKF
jgi:hypothetical protein